MIVVYKKFFLMLGVTVLLCLSASIVWSETMDDLVKRNGVYYKKFSNIPFSGIAKAKEKGIYKGRKPTVDNEKIRELAKQGLQKTTIAKELGIGRATVYRALEV